MQSIMGMETSKSQFAIPNKRCDMEVINHRLSELDSQFYSTVWIRNIVGKEKAKNQFALLNNGMDTRYKVH